MKKALRTEGFAFIEAVSQCPTAFGRRVGLKTAADMLRWLKENSVPLKKAEKMAEEELIVKIVIGEFIQRKRQTFSDAVYGVIREAKKGA